MAEAVFFQMVAEANLSDRIEIDSAGTGNWHEGEPPDRRTISTLKKHGIEWRTKARQVRASDLAGWDYVVPMDHSNERDLLQLGYPAEKVHLMMSFDSEATSDEVPDPYYGSISDFEYVYEILQPACSGLLEEIKLHL